MKYYSWKPTNYIKREYSYKINNDKINNDKINNDEINNDKINNDKINNDKINNDKINKKNILNEKLSNRFLIKQMNNHNPFFTNSNYINDLEIQNKFLRKIN
jgi:hypothetical protein